MSKPSLSDLLVDETLRRWNPEPENPAEQETGPKLAIPRPRTREELADFFLGTLGIVFPSVRVCPGHSTPWDAVCDAFFATTPVTVWKASRAMGGKTFAMGALSFAEALTLRASVTLLGGSGEQSARVLEYLADFWKRPMAPSNALASDPTRAKARLIWGNTVTALTASQHSVSGPHPQRLRVDEVDLVPIKLMDQALGQPMTKDGVDAHVLLSSAHYEPDATLTEVLKRATEKGWKTHEGCWRECVEPHGWLSKSEIARTRSIVTVQMWNVQYDLQEPSPEGRAIDPEKVERMFIGAEIESSVGDGEFPYREFEPPVDGASYATGADWARSRDYVEIVTLRDDVFPLRLVAYQRFRRKAAPKIVAAYERQSSRYPGTGAHDATSLGGQLMNDLLTPEGSDDVSVEGVTMVGRVRQNLFTDYIVEIEAEGIVAPRIGVLYKQHKFVRDKDLRAGSTTGHPPDGFVAGAMAYRASGRSTRPLRLGGSRPVERPDVPLASGSRPVEPPTPPDGSLRAVLDLFGSNGSNGNGHANGDGA